MKSYFHRVVLQCVASQLSTTQVQDMRNLFQTADTSGDGLLSRTELRKTLPALGLQETDSNALMDLMDINNTGTYVLT